MKSIGGVLLAVIILLAMVTIHEFGHYIAGKILHFKIDEFSVGFGPALLKKRSKKTGELFALRLIPLGGYCAFDGEDDTDDEPDKADKSDKSDKAVKADEAAAEKGDAAEIFPDLSAGTPPENTADNPTAGRPSESACEAPGAETTENISEKISENSSSETETRTAVGKEGEKEIGKEAGAAPAGEGKKFNDQPPWKRIVVLVAGATMNYLLALFIIVLMFTCLGRPRSYIVPAAESQITEAGADALQADDVVLSVAGKDLYLITDYVDALNGRKQGEAVRVEVLRLTEERTRQRMTLSIELKADGNFANMSDTGVVYEMLGVDPESCSITFAYMKQGFWESFGDAFVYSWKLGGTVLRSLGELLTGKLGLSSMGGPVTTIRVTAEAASYNLYSFLNIAGFIGVNLAVFNLLPIPALDGSKVIFCLIEWIRRKPVNRKVEAMIHLVGIVFLFAFAILVDVLQFL